MRNRTVSGVGQYLEHWQGRDSYGHMDLENRDHQVPVGKKNRAYELPGERQTPY